MIDPPARLVRLAARVDSLLDSILEQERREWIELDPRMADPLSDLRHLVLGGGKRIRPAYCHWGWGLGGGDLGSDVPTRAGGALELLHAFALAHDDVMDGSPTRRGSPSVWCRFVSRHVEGGWRGEARRFGEGAAVLVGDMAMVLADRTLGDVPADAREVWDGLRTELNMGQYLDVIGTATGEPTVDEARLITRYKTAGYTIVRPLQLGATLAGRPDLTPELTAHGLPLGTAYQLRDDILGAFGDPAITGKPVGDDLREAKPTVLLARARQAATAAQRSVLASVGPDMSDSDLDAVQQVLVDTGAVRDTEAEIDELIGESLTALAKLPDHGDCRVALTELAHFVVDREA